jgi:hypothetical protein
MHSTVDLTIEPNGKYCRVVGGYTHSPNDPNPTAPDTDYTEWPDEHQAAADGYTKTIDQPSTPEDIGNDPAEMETLSWDLISVASDPDLVTTMATYFDGLEPDESTGRLRAKLRLLDVGVYANTQVAARAELRDE